jgi:hypothetical protein
MDDRPPWRSPLAVGLAVMLVAVPTAYSLFSPEVLDNSGDAFGGVWVRVLVALGWIAVAIWAAMVATRRQSKQDAQLEELTRDRSEDLDDRILRRFFPVLEDILRDPAGFPPTYEFTLYVYDENIGKVVPIWPERPQEADVKSFEPGKGATGTAWEEVSLVVVTGDAASDATHGLTPAQQQFFARYRTVVAAPVWWEKEWLVGVLTAVSEEDDGHFNGADAQESMRDLAAVIGPLLAVWVADIAPGVD